MSDDANPYQPPPDIVDARASHDIAIHHWEGRLIRVSGRMLPRMLWLVGELNVQIDDLDAFTSSQLRWNEKFDFAFDHSDRVVSGRLTTYGIAIGGERYRLYIDNILVAESYIRVKHWWWQVGTAVTILAVLSSFVL